MALSFPSEPKNICILRLSAVGDVCHSVPVVRAIQDHWPTTNITWVIGKLESTLVGDIPGVTFNILDKSRGWRAYSDLRREMQGRHFDLLVHMQVSLRSSAVSRLLSSPVRLGFARARARDVQWLFTTNRIEAKKNQHVMDGLLGFADALGIKEPNLRWDIPIRTGRENSPRNTYSRTQGPLSSAPARPLGIATGATGAWKGTRRWPTMPLRSTACGSF